MVYKLCFAIPSWNRAEKLSRCVDVIAGQILEAGMQSVVGIYVSDNCSNDHTADVCSSLCSKYDFFSYSRLDDHVDFSENIEAVLSNAQGHYLWTFGDDDHLLPSGLTRILAVLDKQEVDYIHAGNGWFGPHTNKVYTGTVIDLTCAIGFNGLLGWISSNIVKKSAYMDMLALQEWQHNYKKNAFPHVCGILHVLSGNSGAVVDFAVAAPMGQQEAVDIKRWVDEDVPWRYFLFVYAVRDLLSKGVLNRNRLPNGFFKYLNYYLWDRFLCNMISSSFGEKPFPDEGWKIIELLAEVLEDASMAKLIKCNSAMGKDMCIRRRGLVGQINELNSLLSDVVKLASAPVLPYNVFSQSRL